MLWENLKKKKLCYIYAYLSTKLQKVYIIRLSIVNANRLRDLQLRLVYKRL